MSFMVANDSDANSASDFAKEKVIRKFAKIDTSAANRAEMKVFRMLSRGLNLRHQFIPKLITERTRNLIVMPENSTDRPVERQGGKPPSFASLSFDTPHELFVRERFNGTVIEFSFSLGDFRIRNVHARFWQCIQQCCDKRSPVTFRQRKGLSFDFFQAHSDSLALLARLTISRRRSHFGHVCPSSSSLQS